MIYNAVIFPKQTPNLETSEPSALWVSNDRTDRVVNWGRNSSPKLLLMPSLLLQVRAVRIVYNETWEQTQTKCVILVNNET